MLDRATNTFEESTPFWHVLLRPQMKWEHMRKKERESNVQYWSLQHLSNVILAVRGFFFWGGGHFIEMCSAKFPPVTVKASPQIACHKIQWLQFPNRNIVGFQYWHSCRHFHISITFAILTLRLQLGTNYNFGLERTTLCERGFSKQYWVKIDRKGRLKFETWDALMRVSFFWWKIWIGLQISTLENRPRTRGLYLWNWMVIKCIM